MGLSGYIAFGSALLISILSAALYYTGQWALSERDAAQQAKFALERNILVTKYKDDLQKATSDLQEVYLKRENSLEAEHKEIENDLTKQIMAANDRAASQPIAFGDDLIRDLVRVDCLWASGEASASPRGRKTCRNEAATADATSTGFYYTIFTPEVTAGWRDACGDYPDGTVEDYKISDWKKEYPGFDPRICTDTWVAFSPSMSKYLSRFIANGESYTSRLINYAVSLNSIIDKITKEDSGQKKAPHK